MLNKNKQLIQYILVRKIEIKGLDEDKKKKTTTVSNEKLFEGTKFLSMSIKFNVEQQNDYTYDFVIPNPIGLATQ